MAITVESFNGNDIQSANFESRMDLPDRPFTRESKHVVVRPAAGFPVYVRPELQERVVLVHVTVLSSINSNLDTLEQWFKVGTSGPLVVNFDGTNRVLDCVSRRHIRYDAWPNQFTAVLVAYDPRWRSESATLHVETISTQPATFEITNAGTADEDRAVARVRPATHKPGTASWRYYTEIIIANRVDRPYFKPIDIVDNGWNHSGEVSAGRSETNGDDIRVLVDGVIVPHWPAELNTTTAKIWINAELAPAIEVKLQSAITAGSPANGGELPLEEDESRPLPASGHVLWGDELIKYSGKDDARSTLTGVTRGARGTTAAAHSASAVGYYVQRRIQLMHGYSNAPAPLAHDELKPMLDLASSTNTSWVWADLAHETDPRSAQWARALVSRDDQADRILLPSGEPMASAVFEYQEDGAEASKPAFNTLQMDFPSGLANGGGGNALSFTGRAIDPTLALKVLGRDNDGNEEELTDEGGEVASGTLNVPEPASPIFTIDLYARSQVLRRNPDGSDVGSVTLNTSFDGTGFSFTPATDVQLAGWIAKIGGTVGRNIDSQIVPDDGTDAPGNQVVATATQITTDTGGAGRIYAFLVTASTLLLAGRTYWIEFRADGGGANLRRINQSNADLFFDSGTAVTPAGQTIPIWGLLSRDFETSETNGKADDGDQVTVTGVTANLDSAKTPYFNQLARRDAYWLNGVLSSDTTGQSLTYEVLCETGDDIETDMARGAANSRNVTADEPAGHGVTASDPENGITFVPGANTLRWTEAALQQVVVDIDHFARHE